MAGTQPFTIIFQDEHLVIVEKAPGVLTVPTPRGERNTLVHALGRHLGRGGFVPFLHVVHRLDRDVSGLLVFARTPAVAEALRAEFAAHRPEREYVAIVAGRLPSQEGTFSSRLITGKSLQRRSSTRSGVGEQAVTHYRRERVLDGATLVRVRLETGRRNQIRVHFAEAGHPILGETRYQREQARHPRWRHRRLALHAAVLGFVHPATLERVRFESRLPVELARFVAGSPGVRTR